MKNEETGACQKTATASYQMPKRKKIAKTSLRKNLRSFGRDCYQGHSSPLLKICGGEGKSPQGTALSVQKYILKEKTQVEECEWVET